MSVDDDELDMEEIDIVDARPEADFAAQKYEQHTHQVDGPRLAAALERSGSDDPNVREIITIIETIRQAYGDKDELLARFMEELESGVLLLTMELKAHPGVWFCRSILHMSDPNQAAKEISGVTTFLDAHINELIPDGPND